MLARVAQPADHPLLVLLDPLGAQPLLPRRHLLLDRAVQLGLHALNRLPLLETHLCTRSLVGIRRGVMRRVGELGRSVVGELGVG